MLVRASMHCAGHAGWVVDCSGLLACTSMTCTAAVMLHSHCKLNHFAQFLFMGVSCFVAGGGSVPGGSCGTDALHPHLVI